MVIRSYTEDTLNPVVPRQRQDEQRHDRYLSVPPDDRRQTGSTPGTARVVRTLVVRDAAGRVVSVTKVAPDAMFGVGVKPPPGHTVTEVEAGTLAEDPFGGGPGERPGVRGEA